MPKSNDAEEVRVLRFFEEEPIEKAEVLFNIVQNKMHERRESKTANGADTPPKPRKARKPRRETEENDGNGTPDLTSANN